ncbi:molybdate ABC transporter substrate-binding protein [Bordetella sp. 2513F-2]
MKLPVTLALWVLVLCCFPAAAGEVRVAVASGVATPLRIIAQDFERATGIKVVSTFAATSRLQNEIRQGVGYEVLVAGNSQVPAELVAERMAVEGTRYTYARSLLALWSPRPGYVDDQGNVLRQNRFSGLSMASPTQTAYGPSAMQVLERLGVAQQVLPKVVERRTLDDTSRFLASGEPDLGFVTLSQLYAHGGEIRGSVWRVPTSMYDPIPQDAVILNEGRGNPAARAFLFYLKGPKAAGVLRSYGFAR